MPDIAICPIESKFVQIGHLVDDVLSCNPNATGADKHFTYIDLSAVDQERKIVNGARQITGADAPSRARQVVKAGDVLVSTVRPNLNGVALVQDGYDEAIASTGFSVLRPKPDLLDSAYLFHWVRTPQFINHMVCQATGASYPAVTDRIVRGSFIRTPLLKEQRRIAAILDEADALRAKRRAALAQLDELGRAIFLDMFGDPATNPKSWPVVQIGDLIASATYGTSDKANANGKHAILRMNNITYNGGLDLSDIKYLDLPSSVVDRYTVRKGDILFNRTNSPDLVGKTAVFDKDLPMAFAGYLVRLRTNSEAMPEYISSFLNSTYGKAVLRGMCKTIIGMANINAKEVQRILIPKPPRDLQDQFVTRLRATAILRLKHKAGLERFDSLFASLQHRAFRGEL